jgi:hypothetical protein
MLIYKYMSWKRYSNFKYMVCEKCKCNFRAICISLFAISFCLNSSAQQIKLFEISETMPKDSTEVNQMDSFRDQHPSYLFEDDDYVVKKTCSGEWGGTIWFTSKKTGIMYSCSATCPVAVDKMNGRYFVTNTLAHLDGFSQVIEIDRPTSMDIFKLPKAKRVKGKALVRSVGDNESKSTKGARVLSDSIGILTLASFPYKDQLFYIVTDFQKTYVDKIEGGKFVTVDTVCNISIWTYNPEVLMTKDCHYIVFFKNDHAEGYLDLFENKISLIRQH